MEGKLLTKIAYGRNEVLKVCYNNAILCYNFFIKLNKALNIAS